MSQSPSSHFRSAALATRTSADYICSAIQSLDVSGSVTYVKCVKCGRYDQEGSMGNNLLSGKTALPTLMLVHTNFTEQRTRVKLSMAHVACYVYVSATFSCFTDTVLMELGSLITPWGQPAPV